ncbi:MAG: ABC transporter permease subunit [Caldilineaceae bacterium]|nr:ABC transporter permease subunit [Caldilineaceae bacterium]
MNVSWLTGFSWLTGSSWLTPEAVRLLAMGILVTVALTAITSVLALLLGVAAATLRLSHRPFWRSVGAVYVEIHRNVPALVLIIFYAFALPNLFPIQTRTALFFNNPIMDQLGAWSGIPLAYYALAAILALSMNTGAYIAELFRAGVGAIPQEHVDAARSLGATRRDAYWQILLPEGLRIAFPAISTRLIHNMKNTSLAAFVAVPEFFRARRPRSRVPFARSNSC